MGLSRFRYKVTVYDHSKGPSKKKDMKKSLSDFEWDNDEKLH